MSLRKRKVVHLTPSFGCGGLEKVIVNTIMHGDSEKFEHIVVSLNNDLSFSNVLPDNVKVYSLNKQEGKDYACHARCFSLLRKIKPDVLHTYNFGALEYQAVAALAGVKTRIHADHGLGGDVDQGKSVTKNRFRLIMSGFLKHYVVVSEELKQWLLQDVGVPEHKIKLLRNGVPVPQSMPKKSHSTTNMLHVGRLAPVKNQQRLIQAFSQFCRLRPESDTTLTIVGDGPLRSELAKQVRQLTPEESVRIIFTGQQDDPSNYYSSGDAFVLSSDYEAMPMTALEAMSAGLITLLPAVGGVPDSIPTKATLMYTGHSVEALTQTLVQWFDMTTSQRAAVAVKGFNLANNFSVDKMATEYGRLYSS